MPTDTHIIFHFHFFTSSSPLDENKSLITPIIRKITAIAIKKFLIWKAITVNAQRIPSEPESHGVKKKLLRGLMNVSSPSLVFVVDPTLTSRILLSIAGAQSADGIIKNNERKAKIIRISIYEKKWFISVYLNDRKNANILALIC
jgi:hypothetical protein